MVYFMKPLPDGVIDTSDWNPFLKNEWFRKHFMYFVYILQATLVVASLRLGVWNFANFFIKAGLFVSVYIIHELLHLIVIWKAGDISITHSGIFFWIISGAVLGKLRFFIFMCLPLIGLTLLPSILCFFCQGELRGIAVYIAWVNSIIAGADIINSVLIVMKPNNSVFYRGYYKVKSTL